MGDFLISQSGNSWFIDVLYQSGLFLMVGLAASLALHRRPARAHRVLLLAILGAAIAPLGSQLARRQGWGLWGTASTGAPTSQTPSVDMMPSRPAMVSEDTDAHAVRAAGPMQAGISDATERSRLVAGRSIESETGPPDSSRSRATVSIPIRSVFLGIWGVLSGIGLARLIVSMIVGRQVVSRARPIAQESLVNASVAASTRLGLQVRPDLLASDRTACPAIWCWGRRPVILLPRTAGAAPVDWVGVFCHELAHWVRRDHVSSLIAEVLTCLLPWHPLAWWARHRLGRLSELACDDWALSTGLEATDYAESLLGLVPRQRGALALSAVSSRRGLIGRVRHILMERPIEPVVGRGWAISSAMAMVLAASVIALAQTRPKETKVQVDPRDDAQPTIVPKAEAASDKGTAMRQMIRGAVLDPDAKPISGAQVLWVGYRRFKVPIASLPRDDRLPGLEREVILAQSKAESDGRFVLTAGFDPGEFVSLQAIATAQGFGPGTHYFKKYGNLADPDQPAIRETEVRLVLAPETIVHGRLLTPIGMPASGVRVVLVDFRYGDVKRQGMYVGWSPTVEQVPAYWPQSQKTDAAGRFTLGGVPQGSYATLWFSHPDYAVDEVVVNAMATAPTPSMLQALGMTPVKPDFIHTLEPPRPVQGRVTDKATANPLAGILVDMVPMRRNGGRTFRTRTDSDGRYRISGHQGDSYITTVYPSGDSGYLGSSDHHRGWPVGAKVLERDFALERGRILRGRVIDTDTRRPIAGAGVVYQPRPDNPNLRDGADSVSNPVLSDVDGRFTITGLAGPGDLLVETAGDYIRTKLQLGKNERRALFPQGHALVNVPDKGDAAPVEISLRKGVTVTARVVGPDGNPVSAFAAYCPELSYGAVANTFTSLDFRDGRFILPGADPAQTYRVILTSVRHRLAAVVEIKPAPKVSRPVEIRLQPTARVHGRVVGPSGAPMSEGQVFPLIVLFPKPGPMNQVEIFTRSEFFVNLLETSARSEYSENPAANGEFACDALMPGMLYYIVASSGNREVYERVEPLKPGEDRDLGAITLKEGRP